MFTVTLSHLLSILALCANTWSLDPQCESFPGAEPLIRPGAVVLLGEIHGTKEAPGAVAGIVCKALQLDLGVTVGLEIPHTADEATQAFLAGAGTAEDEARLLASDWWQREYQDGRTSEAMFDLLKSLQASGAHGRNLRVVLIDDPGSAAGRDRAMADKMSAEIDARPRDLFVVLTGNLHNRLEAGRVETMGYLLRLRKPESDIISLNITYGGGTAWVCTPDGCGVRRVGGKSGIAPGVELYLPSIDRAYSGRLHIPEVTASPPARDR